MLCLCCSSSFLRRQRRYNIGDKEGHSTHAGLSRLWKLSEELSVCESGAWNPPTNSWVPVVRFDGASVYFFAAASGWHVAIQAVLSEHASWCTTGIVWVFVKLGEVSFRAGWVGVGVTRRAYHLSQFASVMLDCVVDSARSKALVRRLRARCCVDRHPELIVQLRKASTDVVLPHNNVVCVTSELRRRSSDAVLSNVS